MLAPILRSHMSKIEIRIVNNKLYQLTFFLPADICSLRLDFESFSLAGPSTGTDTELEFLLAHEFQGGLCDQVNLYFILCEKRCA